MKLRIPTYVALCVATLSVTSAFAQREEGCSDALVMSTYSRGDLTTYSSLLAFQVSERAYNEIKQKAGASAEIYGVPVGANYGEFRRSIQESATRYTSTLTLSQATNILWTGLDPSGANAYIECIRAKAARNNGLSLGVRAATKEEIAVLVTWSPRGNQGRAKPIWSLNMPEAANLPRELQPGDRVFTLPRPTAQRILTVNFEGHSDQLVLEPFPTVPPTPPIQYVDDIQIYEGAVAEGWSINWGRPVTVCTPEMPSGWTITKVDFRLESSTERGSCGAWTNCSGQETDTPRRACRTVSVQGHTGGKFEGWGRAKPVLTVTWRRPR